MELPSSLANIISNKLGKDELYSFLAGLLLGTAYFLCLVSSYDCAIHKFAFSIEDNYYLSLFFLLFWLSAVVLIFICYRIIFHLGIKSFNKWIAQKYPQGIPTNPDYILRMEQLEEVGIDAHIWGLAISLFILLIPMPWIIFIKLSLRHFYCWGIVSTVTMSIIIFGLIHLGKWASMYRTFLFVLIENRKIKVSFNNNEWEKNYNSQVQRQALIEKAD